MRTVIFLALFAVASTGHAQSIDNTADSSSQSASQTYGSVSNNIVTQTPRKQEVKTTAGATIGGFAGSFSPDYCSGTAGGSVGVTGLGVSLGGPKVDENCQQMRRVERFGQLAAQAHNLGNRAQAQTLMQLAIFEVCTSSPDTTDACLTAGLVINDAPAAP